MKHTPPNLLGLDPSRPEDGLPIPWPPPAAGGALPDPEVGTGGLLGLDPGLAAQGAPAPWPPPRGLDPEQDPFSRSAKADEPAGLPPERGLGRLLGRRASLPPERRPAEELPVPLFALDLEEAALEAAAPPSRWGFTQDRAVALSIVLHVLLALLVVVAPPARKAENPDELPPDLLGLNKLWAIPPSNPPIPVQFYPAPGPKAPEPGARPRPSDVDRQAHGGDPRLPKADTPKAVAGPGVRDLAPGRRGEAQGEQGRDKAAPGEGARAEAAPPPAGPAAGSPEKPADNGLVAHGKKGLAGLAESPLRQISATDAARAASRDGGGRPAGGGDEGAGWESEGGFVDSGPLSFDTKGYDWGPYAAEMIRKIKRNWEIPKLAHYGMKGRLVIRFFLLADGRVEGIRLLVSSGVPPYDNAALQAVRNSNPFRALPPDFPNPREGVTITFLYNIRPEDLDGSEAPKEPPRPLLPR